MPSLSRSTTMPTVIYPKPARSSRASSISSSKDRFVGFLRDPVSSISRPCTDEEDQAAWEFEHHASQCAYCMYPLRVQKEGQRLCKVGHSLAQKVARYIYRNAQGEICSTTEEEQNVVVRVEVPTDYYAVKELLKAIDRSLRHRSKEPIISMDRSYYVPARLPQRSRSVKLEQPTSKPKVSRPRSGEIVDWPSAPPKGKIYTEVNSTAYPKRGSLYAEDVADLRRKEKLYRVEVREPSQRDIRENRLSGYYR